MIDIDILGNYLCFFGLIGWLVTRMSGEHIDGSETVITSNK